MPNRSLLTLGVLLGLLSSSGATCVRQEIAPVLPPTAQLDQLTGLVNDRTALVHSTIGQGTLSVPGAPSLAVNVALMPPLRFRLRASTALTGPELDLGSNDELFWMWVRRSQPPALFYCRHDQFASSAARQIMPVEPQWIVEAMGLATFNPADRPQGPIPVGKGRVQIRTVQRSLSGDLSKVTVLDATRGLVLEQHLYDAQGKRIASALTSEHRRDPICGAILPRHIEIEYPSSQLSLKIDLSDLQVNTVAADNSQLWTKPEYTGFPNMNLAEMNAMAQGNSGPPAGGQLGPAAAPYAAAPQPQYAAGPTAQYAPPQGAPYPSAQPGPQAGLDPLWPAAQQPGPSYSTAPQGAPPANIIYRTGP